MIDRKEVIAAYRLMLGRPPESEEVVRLGTAVPNLPRLIAILCDSDEYKERARADVEGTGKRALIDRHNGPLYATPVDLARTPTPARRVAFIGACFAESWIDVIRQYEPEVDIEFHLVTHVAVLPPLEAARVGAYDFHVVQIPLRSVLPEHGLMRLGYLDEAGHAALFDQAKVRLAHLLDAAMAWCRTHGITTFVGNYMVPQRAAMGRLLPRYDLRNSSHVIARLNEELARKVAGYEHAHILDIDEMSSVWGKRFIQDDAVWLTSHGGMLNDWDHAHDGDRLHPAGAVSNRYVSHVGEFVLQVWAELQAMRRTLLGTDRVKLVIFDLDDTLWRGVAAETGASTVEGWPLGVLEALSILRKRGVLLAIVSKNDEARIAEIWDSIFGGRFRLSDFVARRINWDDKATNVGAVLAAVNVLPESVVFVDDNPAEVAAVSAAFPGLRCLGADPLYLRRILLWAPETQVPFVTDESARRSEMIAGQIRREDLRPTMSRDAFLATLDLRCRLARIEGVAGPPYQRAFELLNKTNQFNTTGRRWSPEEGARLMASGGVLHTVAVDDIYNAYGVVGVCVVEGGHIRQVVLSCRVFGLDVELAFVATVVRALFDRGATLVTGEVAATRSNGMSLDLFRRLGFDEDGDAWLLADPDALPRTTFIHLEIAPDPAEIVVG